MIVMVLNDGETYTDLTGCKIVQIDNSYEGDDIDVAIEKVYEGDSDVLGRIVAVFREHEGKAVYDLRSEDALTRFR